MSAKLRMRRPMPGVTWTPSTGCISGRNSSNRRERCLVARSGARLVGYLAMKQWAGHSYYLLECRCREADPEIARELILAAREFARQKQARSILVRPYTPMIEAAVPATVSVKLKKPPMTYYYSSRTGNIGRQELGSRARRRRCFSQLTDRRRHSGHGLGIECLVSFSCHIARAELWPFGANEGPYE